MTPNSKSRISVAAAETSSDPTHPSRLEKKMNTACSYPARAGPRRTLAARSGAVASCVCHERRVGSHELESDREGGTVNERDTKLIQWLNEAHAKESELEADLTAHIALTKKQPYKKRLREHLEETRDHKRSVARHVKKLGGSPSTAKDRLGVPKVVGERAGKTVAGVKGKLGAARALVTSQPETHLRNAQEELREEHVEIAIYTRLEALAEEVGDDATAKLARAIRRDEERMAKFLDAELKRLVRELVKEEIPRDQRRSQRRQRRSSARTRSRGTSRSGSRRSMGRSTRKA
jgi:ferritin-like metal-binding protein YciE